MFEDVAFTYECLLFSEHVYICSEPLYCYNRTNVNAMTMKERIYISENYYLLVDYLRKRLLGRHKEVDRQLNEMPVIFIIRDIQQGLKKHGIFETARRIKASLKDTPMLQFVNAKGLPKKQALIVTLLKMKMYRTVVLLFRAIEK